MNKYMALFFLIALSGQASEGASGRDFSFNLAAWPNRPYLVHIPPGYNKNTPTPLVLSLHGGGGNAQTQMKISCPLGNLDAPECLVGLSDHYNFIAVHPNGTEMPNYPGRRAWGDGENDSNCDICHKA